MTNLEKYFLRMTYRLISVSDEVDLSNAILRSSKDFDSKLVIAFIKENNALRLISGQNEMIDRLFACLPEQNFNSVDMSKWRIPVSSPLISKLMGGRILSTRVSAEKNVIKLDADEFLKMILPFSINITDNIASKIQKELGIDQFSIIPAGKEEIPGAVIVGSLPDCIWYDNFTEGLESLGRLMVPVLLRMKKKRMTELLTRDTEAAGEIAAILARPRWGMKRRLDECLTVILKTLAADTGSIMLREGKNLIVTAATNRKIVGMKQALKSDNISAQVARSGEVLNLKSVENLTEKHDGKLSTYYSDQVLSAPIVAGNKVVGVLNVTNRRDFQSFNQLDEDRVTGFLQRIGGLLDRANLTEALKVERARLKKANQELVSLEILKKDLTNMVVHDLKGPLAEIMANLHMIGGDEISEFASECVEAGLIGIEDMRQMIGNLLDISKMDEGRMNVKKAPVNPVEIFEKTRNRLNSLFKLNEIGVMVKVEENLPRVMADENLLDRVIQNLMTNAIDHTPMDSKVTFSAWKENGMVILSLADQGSGVPEQHREEIFEMFRQTPDQYQPRTSTGLGLTFCRMAVEAHGGKIWATDAEGGGADFRFTLPYEKEK